MTDIIRMIRMTGEALYGPRWQRQLARVFGKNERTVRGWLEGRGRPKPGVLAELGAVLRQQSARLACIADEIDPPKRQRKRKV